MANVIYDRTGKAHVIGGGKKSESESDKPKKAETHEKKPSGKAGKKAGAHSGKKAGSNSGKKDHKGGGGKANPWKKDAERREGRSRPTGGNRNYGEPVFSKNKARGAEGSFVTTGERKSHSGPIAHGERSDRPRPGASFKESEGEGGGGRFGRGGSGRGGSERGGRGGRGGSGRGGEVHGRGGRGGERSAGGRGKDERGKRGGGHYAPPQERPRKATSSTEDQSGWTRLKGVVDKNKRGSGFLIFDRRDLEDLFIPRYYLDQLFHGDRVEVAVNEDGEIEDIKVLQHRFKEIFGRITLDVGYDRGKPDGAVKKAKPKVRAGFLIYERKKAKEEVWVPSVPPEVKEGDWVKAEVIFAEGSDGKEAKGKNVISAKILEVIGKDLPAIYDIQMVAGEFNLTEHHTFEAVKQAESYKLEIPGKDEVGRTDLRHIPFMTIDGERARDFDDAVFVERTNTNGFRLWVAIADVSHYVKETTPLDNEAYARGTSVYFPERAFHMLPRALSEELCSLKPNVPRLTMAVSIEYSSEGEKGEIKLYDAIIESRRRATYTEIQTEIDDPKHAEMVALYRILRVKRNDRGSIDFDFPEAEIILDEKSGEPSDIVVRERQDSNRLIEEFMIAANESVTEWMLSKKLPFIYRIHEEPSIEAIEKFKKLARNMGVTLAGPGGVPRPAVLAAFIKTLKGHPAETVLATGLLRSMRQAIYSATHGEHFGLASEAYTHFTSPIRRYPDLLVHRQLRAALHAEQDHGKKLHGKALDQVQEKLEEAAEHCSYRERIASEAERESIRFKQVRLMAKHLGKEFEGKVSGLNDKGIYVQLFSPYCEGMVQVESMKDDWYEFNDERMMMSGRRTKRMFQVGTAVKIQVVRVDLDSRQVEFELI